MALGVPLAVPESVGEAVVAGVRGERVGDGSRVALAGGVRVGARDTEAARVRDAAGCGVVLGARDALRTRVALALRVSRGVGVEEAVPWLDVAVRLAEPLGDSRVEAGGVPLPETRGVAEDETDALGEGVARDAVPLGLAVGAKLADGIGVADGVALPVALAVTLAVTLAVAAAVCDALAEGPDAVGVPVDRVFVAEAVGVCDGASDGLDEVVGVAVALPVMLPVGLAVAGTVGVAVPEGRDGVGDPEALSWDAVRVPVGCVSVGEALTVCDGASDGLDEVVGVAVALPVVLPVGLAVAGTVGVAVAEGRDGVGDTEALSWDAVGEPVACVFVMETPKVRDRTGDVLDEPVAVAVGRRVVLSVALAVAGAVCVGLADGRDGVPLGDTVRLACEKVGEGVSEREPGGLAVTPGVTEPVGTGLGDAVCSGVGLAVRAEVVVALVLGETTAEGVTEAPFVCVVDIVGVIVAEGGGVPVSLADGDAVPEPVA